MLLIYFPQNKLAPKGGPAGYLHSLTGQLKKEGFEFELLPNVEDSYVEGFRDKIPKRLKDFRRALKACVLHRASIEPAVDFNKYDIIHFHSTEDLYLCRKALESYKGKVILTSHSPCSFQQEMLNRLNAFDRKLFSKQLASLENIDRFSFVRADYVIFPCEEAEEPYYNTWKAYPDVRDKEKYRYMPTGTVQCKAKVSKDAIRQKYGIPEDAFIVSYVGRHNEIKGYADLKEIGEKVLEDKKVYFLIAGKEEPLTGYEHERWIEVGWTNDPHSIIAASDIFVLPNKETYFDLILLEVMSLGKPVVLTRTGGNNYFLKYNKEGFKYYSGVDEAVAQIDILKNMSDKKRRIIGNELSSLFTDEFSLEPFGKKYIEIIQSIRGMC